MNGENPVFMDHVVVNKPSLGKMATRNVSDLYLCLVLCYGSRWPLTTLHARFFFRVTSLTTWFVTIFFCRVIY